MIKRITILLFTLLLLVGCTQGETNQQSGDEVKLPKDFESAGLNNTEAIDEFEKKEESRVWTLEDHIEGLIEEYNQELSNVQLPEEHPYLHLIGSSFGHFAEDGSFSINFKMEYRDEDSGYNEGKPIDIHITNEDIWEDYLKEGYEEDSLYELHYLISPNEDTIIIDDGNYQYAFSTQELISYFGVEVYSDVELPDIARTLTTSSPYKEVLSLDSEDYLLPSYLPELKQGELSLSVNYSIDPQNRLTQDFIKDNQSFIIRNDYLRLTQALGNSFEVEDLLSRVENGYFKTIEEGPLTTYLNEDEAYELFFQTANLSVIIQPRQEADQTTGKVYTLKPENWEEEVINTLNGFSLENFPIVSSEGVGQLQDNWLTFGGVFEIFDISLNDSQEKVRHLLGEPDEIIKDEAGYYTETNKYNEMDLLVHYNNEKVDAVQLAVDQATFETLVEESFEGETIQSEDGDVYLFIEESEQLIRYSEEENGMVSFMLMEADENFYYWIE